MKPMVRTGLAAAVAPRVLSILVAALLFVGCDTGGRSTRVSGPDFVGFGYTTEDLNGTWSGTLLTEFGFQTVVIEIGVDGAVTGGNDSRWVAIAEGAFEFLDFDTGEIEFTASMDDGVAIGARGLLEPGAKRIRAQFASNLGFLGTIALARTGGAGSFDSSQFAERYRLELLPTSTLAAEEGELHVDRENETILAGSHVGDIPVTSGTIRVTESTQGSMVAILSLSNGGSLALAGLMSLADGRIAGVSEIAVGAEEGFFTLEALPTGAAPQ